MTQKPIIIKVDVGSERRFLSAEVVFAQLAKVLNRVDLVGKLTIYYQPDGSVDVEAANEMVNVYKPTRIAPADGPGTHQLKLDI